MLLYRQSEVKKWKFEQNLKIWKSKKAAACDVIDISPGISFSYILCIVISYLSKFDEHSSPLLLLGNRQITII